MVKKVKPEWTSQEFIDAVRTLREGPKSYAAGPTSKLSLNFIAKILATTEHRVRQVLNNIHLS